MRKIIKISIPLLFIALIAYAATRNIDSTGVWTDSGIWAGGLIGGPTDDVTMSNTVDVTVENGDNITVISLTASNNNTITIDAGGTLTLDNNPSPALLTAGNGIVINVDGSMIINGDVQINNNLTFNVTGTLTINGNVNMNNNATLDVAPGGNVDVNGDFTGGNNTSVNVDGTMDVSGNINVGNGSALTGSGTMTTGGTCSDAGSGFCSGAPLPIDLMHFEGIPLETSIKLVWASASEENFDFYTIEKSLDAINFQPLVEVTGLGGKAKIQEYVFIDEVPLAGINYYRLKATDLDGSVEYHRIIGVNFDDEIIRDFKMYPNPAAERQLTIRSSKAGTGVIEIYDSFGTRLYRDDINSVSKTILLPPNWKEGVYIVRFITSGSVTSQRLVVEY